MIKAMAAGTIYCHKCNGEMERVGFFFVRCKRCKHTAELVLPPDEYITLFNDEVQYKQSMAKHGGGQVQGKKPTQKKKGLPWYHIDRLGAEGSPKKRE